MKRIVLLWGILLMGAMLVTCSPKSVPSENITTPEVLSPEGQIVAKEDWQVEWEKTLKNAKKEEVVVVYGGGGPEGRDVLIKGMNSLGLKAEVLSLKSSQLVSRLASERAAGLHFADIYIGGANTGVGALKPAGYLDRIDAMPILPDVTNPSVWYENKGIRYIDADPYFDNLQGSSAAAANY